MNHLQACEYCPNYGVIDEVECDGEVYKTYGCTIYSNAILEWVNRRGGCPSFPFRDLPRHMEYLDGNIVTGNKRPGQQKQVKSDRKYDNNKVKRRHGKSRI